MGYKVSREDMDKADTGGARWDRPLAPGIYAAEVLYGGMEVSKSTGNEMMKFTLVMDAPDTAAPEGQVKLDYFVASAWAAKNFLQAFSPDSLNDGGEDVEIEPSDFVGATCRVKVTSEKYEGSMRPKIALLMPLEPAKGEKPATTTAKPATPAAKQQAAPAATAAAGSADDDDVSLPF